jgi:dynein heavy chain
LCQSITRILDCYFAPYIETEFKKVPAEDIDNLELLIQDLFVYALIWGIGATSTYDGRIKFDKWLREKLQKEDVKTSLPAEGLCHDFCFDINIKEWKEWIQTVDEYKVDVKLSFNDIVVPTNDSIRMKYLMKLLLMHHKHMLTPGPTGTGKSVNIAELLIAEMPEDFQSLVICFSAQTSANNTQDYLDDKFEKRRKGVYGPSPGKKFIIFIDDLNMPKKEEYGAQPPIELLRQWMDHNGWYDRK